MYVVALIEDAEARLTHLLRELGHAHSPRRDKISGAVLKVERSRHTARPLVLLRCPATRGDSDTRNVPLDRALSFA